MKLTASITCLTLIMLHVVSAQGLAAEPMSPGQWLASKGVSALGELTLKDGSVSAALAAIQGAQVSGAGSYAIYKSAFSRIANDGILAKWSDKVLCGTFWFNVAEKNITP